MSPHLAKCCCCFPQCCCYVWKKRFVSLFVLFYKMYSQQKMNNLCVNVDKDRIEQCFAAHIVQCCQQYCSIFLTNDNYEDYREQNNVQSCCT